MVLPAAELASPQRERRAIDVRLYTIAGGRDAETDAPLYEPPVALPPDADKGREEGSRSAAAAEPVTPEPADAPPAPEPDPVTPDASADVGEAPVPDAAARSRAAEAAGSVNPPGAGGASTGAAPPAPTPADPDAPVSTVQVRIEPARPGARQAPPDFADILARARPQLDPADFKLAQFAAGSRQTVTEVFCLSSPSGNRDALACGDAPNAASAELARYGLMELGEQAPEFLEDLSRLEFELRTLGADDSQVARILAALRASRRQAVETSPVTRQMARDSVRRDNLGTAIPED